VQIVRFGVPNSPKAGQNSNSTSQSKLLKYVLAVGLDFGKTDVSPEARIGVTPALTTEWNRHVPHLFASPIQFFFLIFFSRIFHLSNSNTLVFCRTASGIGILLGLIVTADLRVGTTTEVATYDAENIDGMLAGLISPPLRSNFATTGSLSITVAGRNFGINYISLFGRGGYTNCEFSIWLSDTAVQCFLKAGFQTTLRRGPFQHHSKFILVIIF
jgi:hypothetical protein